MSDIQLIKQRWLDAMSPIAKSHEEFVAQVFSDFERIDAKYHELDSAQFELRKARWAAISEAVASSQGVAPDPLSRSDSSPLPTGDIRPGTTAEPESLPEVMSSTLSGPQQ